jgi:hypothetical protein
MLHLSQWYHVHFDENLVYREVTPPKGAGWSDQFAFMDIVRVCFLTQDLWAADELYIFTSGRAESYKIPTEADGGRALLDELVRRGLFPAELLIEAVTTEDQLFCYPPPEESVGQG